MPMFAPMGWKCLFSVVRYCTSAPHMVSAGGAGSSFAFQPGIQAAGRQQAAGSAFHIALKAGDLPCKEHIGVLFQAQLGAEHPGRIEEGVAVHDAIPHELGILQARGSC